MDYSICIVTYHARFEKFFKPLINKLGEVFPDKKIVCILNGYSDSEIQKDFLNKAESFLKTKPSVVFHSYVEPQGLAKCWNDCLSISSSPKNLILNDDVEITKIFRQEFEKKVLPEPLATINGSWSHFLISQEIIEKVGWFDEGFQGMGQEDADYMFRLSLKNIPITNIFCSGIINYVAPPTKNSWENKTELVGNKYSKTNFDFIKTKYWISDIDKEHTEWTNRRYWRNGFIEFTPKISNVGFYRDESEIEKLRSINTDRAPILTASSKNKASNYLFGIAEYYIIKVIRKIFPR